jgi:hypothetical protein
MHALNTHTHTHNKHSLVHASIATKKRKEKGERVSGNLRVGGRAEERILAERLEGEAAEELGEAGVGGVVLGAVVDVHGEDEEGDIDYDDEGDEQGDPSAIFILSMRRRQVHRNPRRGILDRVHCIFMASAMAAPPKLRRRRSRRHGSFLLQIRAPHSMISPTTDAAMDGSGTAIVGRRLKE